MFFCENEGENMKIKKILVGCGAIFATLGLVSCATSEGKDPVTEVVEYTVTFDYKNGNPSASSQIQEGQKVIKPTDPIKEGFKFIAWYKEDTYVTVWNFDEDVVTGNITLYAKWEEQSNPKPPVPIKYSVTYVINGHGEQPEKLTEVAVLPAELPVLSAEGWTFEGWYTDAEFKTAAVAGATITSNVTLYAKWTEKETPPAPEKYSVTYIINGHGIQPEKLTEVTALPAELPVLTAEGWTFEGWFSDAEFKTAAVAGTELSANATLYAKWTEKETPPAPEKYSVTYIINGHGIQPEKLTEVTALPAELPVLSAEGWIFEGWFSDAEFKTAAIAGAELSSNVILYAKWTEEPVALEMFSISYNINGKGEQPTNINEALALPEELPVLTDSQYVFAGWYLDENFNVKATPGMVLSEDVTLYAKWVSENDFIIDKAEGYLEGTYLEWKTFADCTEYNVYYKKSNESS